jgi:hypothetical protein
VTALRTFAQDLGIPGLFDVHTHFLPPRVMAKVRHQFDTAGPLIGRAWPLAYRGDDEHLVATLRGFGVRRFSALAYAHRPGMAEFLNDWAFGFAERTAGCLRSATFYTEPGAASYVAARLAAGAEIFKVHVQVGGFDVLDPLLTDVWGLLEDAGTPVVIHAGSGPVSTPYTGPEPVADLLARFPRLALVIAHLGAPEYTEFVALAETYERVRLDTTMVFTPFFEDLGGGPRRPGATAARATAEGAARLGLPPHPLRLRRAAGRAQPARARRRVAPVGLLGERGRTLRTSACPGGQLGGEPRRTELVR